MTSEAVDIRWLPGRAERTFDVKDPSVLAKPDGSYEMYASVGYSGAGKEIWHLGHFRADCVDGVWHELEPPTLHGLRGAQLCAPAVAYDAAAPAPYTMYIQTACFEPGGVVMRACSEDGTHFHGDATPLITKESVGRAAGRTIVGVYDASHSIIEGGRRECITFTALTHVGPKLDCGSLLVAEGDIYAMFRHRRPKAKWSRPRLQLKQSDLPFHNRPNGHGYYEWCIEGAKLIDLEDGHFLVIGVCFLDKPEEAHGQRQRVFVAAGKSAAGPFAPIGTPITPQSPLGENGHPDTISEMDKVHVFYQERAGNGLPWHLRRQEYSMDELREAAETALHRDAPHSELRLPAVPAAIPLLPPEQAMPIYAE